MQFRSKTAYNRLKRGIATDRPQEEANDLAALYYSQRRYGEAEPLYVLGENHPNTQTAWGNFRYLIRQAIAAGRSGELSDHPLPRRWCSSFLGLNQSELSQRIAQYQRCRIECVKIEEAPILPTAEQNFASVCVCQMLSNYYRAIELFRFNERTGELYIFASEELQIIIPRDGRWRFV